MLQIEIEYKTNTVEIVIMSGLVVGTCCLYLPHHRHIHDRCLHPRTRLRL